MTEAVTVPSLMMMTSTVSEESLVRDTHTYTHTYTHTGTDFCVVYLKLFQSRKRLGKKPTDVSKTGKLFVQQKHIDEHHENRPNS